MVCEIEPGSIVQVTSGGPHMTVRWVEDDEAYRELFPAKAARMKGPSFSRHRWT